MTHCLVPGRRESIEPGIFLWLVPLLCRHDCYFPWIPEVFLGVLVSVAFGLAVLPLDHDAFRSVGLDFDHNPDKKRLIISRTSDMASVPDWRTDLESVGVTVVPVLLLKC